MSDLFAAAASIDAACRRARWPYCIIGGMAVLRWGEPRQTRDVDLTILTGYGGEEEEVVDALLAEFDGRVDGPRDFARRGARHGRGRPLLEVKGAPGDLDRLRHLLDD